MWSLTSYKEPGDSLAIVPQLMRLKSECRAFGWVET